MEKDRGFSSLSSLGSPRLNQFTVWQNIIKTLFYVCCFVQYTVDNAGSPSKFKATPLQRWERSCLSFYSLVFCCFFFPRRKNTNLDFTGEPSEFSQLVNQKLSFREFWQSWSNFCLGPWLKEKPSLCRFTQQGPEETCSGHIGTSIKLVDPFQRVMT